MNYIVSSGGGCSKIGACCWGKGDGQGKGANNEFHIYVPSLNFLTYKLGGLGGEGIKATQGDASGGGADYLKINISFNFFSKIVI